MLVELKSDKGIEELRYAIVKQACNDYQEALVFLRGKEVSDCELYIKMQRQKAECEAFFLSEWFGILCNIEGKCILETIRKQYYNRPIRWHEKGE